MKKLYEKNELTFAIVWIVVYCVLQSVANPLNKLIGVDYSVSAALAALIVITVAYTLILAKTLPKSGSEQIRMKK